VAALGSAAGAGWHTGHNYAIHPDEQGSPEDCLEARGFAFEGLEVTYKSRLSSGYQVDKSWISAFAEKTQIFLDFRFRGKD
jgi:hypothetical protein